ncbi:MAG: DUF4836 family protein [Ginsengibacter sp.]
MKSFFRLTLLFVAAAFLFSSCSKKNEEGKMIPKNAMFVVHFNTKSLKEKLSWDDIKQANWYKKAYTDSETTGWIKRLLNDPENSGIDLNGGLIFFVAKNPGTNGEMVLEGTVKNAGDFGQFNKNLDSTATLKKDGNLNMLTIKNKIVVAWDDEHFTYAFDAADARSKLSSMNAMGSNGNMAPLVNQTTDLSAVCRNLFSLKSDSSLAGNEKFTNLLKETGDIHTWVNTEEIMNSTASLGMVGMLKLDVFLKDNISTYAVSFDNGKINISQKLYAGKEFSDFLKKYSGDNISTDMIKNIPSQNVLGVFAMNFKPEGLKELIKLTGMDGFLNMFTGQIGFNIDDFVKANKGEIMLALTDLSMKNILPGDNAISNDSASYSFKKPDMNFLFSVEIGDKPSFQKLVEAGKKMTGEMGKVNDTSISFAQNDKVFAVSNHQHFLNDYLAGNANNKYNFIDKLTGHPIGLFIDIHKILSEISSEKKMNPDNELIVNESLKLWNNIYATGGEFKDGGIVGNTEINFIDQSANSLKQLNHYLDTIASVEMAKKEREKSEMSNTDSLMMPPPIDTVGNK